MFQPSFVACRAFQLRTGLSSSGIAAQFAARCPKVKYCILEPQTWHGDPFHPQTWTPERSSLECFEMLWVYESLCWVGVVGNPCGDGAWSATWETQWVKPPVLWVVWKRGRCLKNSLSFELCHWGCFDCYTCTPPIWATLAFFVSLSDLSRVLFDGPNVCGTLRHLIQFGPSQLSLAQTRCIAYATPQIAQRLPFNSFGSRTQNELCSPTFTVLAKEPWPPIEVQRRHKIITQTDALHSI